MNNTAAQTAAWFPNEELLRDALGAAGPVSRAQIVIDALEQEADSNTLLLPYFYEGTNVGIPPAGTATGSSGIPPTGTVTGSSGIPSAGAGAGSGGLVIPVERGMGSQPASGSADTPPPTQAPAIRNTPAPVAPAAAGTPSSTGSASGGTAAVAASATTPAAQEESDIVQSDAAAETGGMGENRAALDGENVSDTSGGSAAEVRSSTNGVGSSSSVTTGTEVTVVDSGSSNLLFSGNLPLFILGGALLLAVAAAAVLWTRLRQARGTPAMPVSQHQPPSAVPQAPSTDRMSQTAPVPRSMPKATPVPPTSAPVLRVGKMQNIGKRQSQQDSFGTLPLQGGVLAVVADGMGGLSDGDKVSRAIVQSMLRDANGKRADQLNLLQLLSRANSDVNAMLGQSAQYKSGSTVLLVIAEPGRFRWVSVGDSRIYLYRGGGLLQVNHEHAYEAELLNMAVNRKLSFPEAEQHEKRRSITSFVGMGELKYIDQCLNPVQLLRGDRILLMSDGVFNALSDPEIARVMVQNADPNRAAAALESAVVAKGAPRQDNFTAVIVEYS